MVGNGWWRVVFVAVGGGFVVFVGAVNFLGVADVDAFFASGEGARLF